VLVYAAILLAIWVPYALLRRRASRRSQELLRAAERDALMEPASLHPLIDESLCLGCASCVDACPEHDVLGLLHGKAVLATPANCIGHGACREACPTGAITLVLGTEKRGVDIPLLGGDFQTNVPGVFVAGELGGMGLIRNAIEQGRQAIDAIARREGAGGGAAVELDVVIVGAGPAGFSASLAAMQKRLRYVTVEQETLGGTVAHYPRGKIVMTAPVELPLYGRVSFRETTKEALLALWTRVARSTGVEIRYQEPVVSVTPTGAGFEVKTPQNRYLARNVLLAIGRRGTPRKLGVPGEESPKVVYRLVDPEQYRGQHVLVVGGGDSALEAALGLADVRGTFVSISYRQGAFSRAKARNRSEVERARSERRLSVFLGSEVERIDEKTATLRIGDEATDLRNDAVIVCAGGVLPTPFLRSIGIQIETKRGTA
jgi:thioredoxin reductase/NAD-dependent dihydropyrimidine dehydrogenase PreA subunit